MVLNIQQVPAPAAQRLLPVLPDGLELQKAKRMVNIVHQEAVSLHTLERNHHIQLGVLASDELERALCCNEGRFADGHAVVIVEHGAEFAEIFVQVRAVVILENAARHGHVKRRVRQSLGLGDVGDNILAEAVHAHIQPEAQDFLYLGADAGIIHVQIGLLNGKDVEIVRLSHLVILPRLALEHAVPVVGERPVLFRLAPDIVIPVRFLPAAARLKPRVFVARVVHNKVHDDFDAAFMRAVEHLFERRHPAVFGGDIHIVRHVVTEIGVRRGVER